MQSLKCTPISSPALPDASNHYLWTVWDRALELCLLQITHHCNSFNDSTSSFFDEQLIAFEVWLQSDNIENTTAAQLPTLLQVLLSQTLRERALQLLCRFLDLGPWACDQALAVGIFPYILKLLSSTTSVDFYEYLVFCWMKILVVDKKKTFHQNLIREHHHHYFLNVLKTNSTSSKSSKTNVYALFVLTSLLDETPPVKTSLLQANLLNVLTVYLDSDNPDVRTWTLLCLSKLWDTTTDIKLHSHRHGITTNLISHFQDASPQVRVALLTSLTTLFTDPVPDLDDFSHHVLLNAAVLVHDACPQVREALLVLYQRLAKLHQDSALDYDIFTQIVDSALRDPTTTVSSTAEILQEILQIYNSKGAPPNRRIAALTSVTSRLYEARVFALSESLLTNPLPSAPSSWHRRHYLEARTSFTLTASEFEDHRLHQTARLTLQDDVAPGCLMYHPTLPLLVVAPRSGSSIRIVDANVAAMVTSWTNANPINTTVTDLAWLNSTDSPLLATSCNDGTIRIWRNWDDTPDLVSAFAGVLEPCTPDVGSKIAALGERRLLTAGSAVVRLWDLETEQLISNIRMKNSVTCAREYAEFNEQMFIVGTAAGKVLLYDNRLPTNEREVNEWKLHRAPVIDAFRPSSGNTIVAGVVASKNEQSSVALIDARMGTVRKITVPKLTSFAAHKTASFFVVGSSDQFVRSYNSESGKIIQEIKYYDGFFGHRINPVVNLAIDQFSFNTAVSTTDNNITLFGFE